MPQLMSLNIYLEVELPKVLNIFVLINITKFPSKRFEQIYTPTDSKMSLSNHVVLTYTSWFLHWASLHVLNSHLHFLCELHVHVLGLIYCFSSLICESSLAVLCWAKGYVCLKFWWELLILIWMVKSIVTTLTALFYSVSAVVVLLGEMQKPWCIQALFFCLDICCPKNNKCPTIIYLLTIIYLFKDVQYWLFLR